jgi:membrane associated rhomboid family serine protease
VANPTSVTVGASGAIFGLLGAGLILEYQATGSLAGNYLTLIVINLAISFAVPGISIGGHLGGLVGGTLATLAFSRFGRGHAAYGKLGLLGAASLVAIAVGSVLIAYWKVRGLAY